MANSIKRKLIEHAHTLGVYDIAATVIADPRFEVWSGSSKPHQHHYGKGGLIQHTYEVVELCISNVNLLKLDIDPIEIYLSALFHDVGKMWDYEPVDKNYKEWRGTEHKRLIHHISRSALVWNSACIHHCFKYNKYADNVTHNILSHHGMREWGSPVMPKTKAAWLLHLCDGISARMNDADKFDKVNELK
jgi:3'-5' exoribonuclease